jgi:hypothetical protein
VRDLLVNLLARVAIHRQTGHRPGELATVALLNRYLPTGRCWNVSP